MTSVRLKYVHAFVDRHGHARYYFRYRGDRWPLPAPSETGFFAAYEAIKKELAQKPMRSKIGFMRGSLGWAIEQFTISKDFRERAPGTQASYRRILDELRRRYGAGKLSDL